MWMYSFTVTQGLPRLRVIYIYQLQTKRLFVSHCGIYCPVLTVRVIIPHYLLSHCVSKAIQHLNPCRLLTMARCVCKAHRYVWVSECVRTCMWGSCWQNVCLLASDRISAAQHSVWSCIGIGPTRSRQMKEKKCWLKVTFTTKSSCWFKDAGKNMRTKLCN